MLGRCKSHDSHMTFSSCRRCKVRGKEGGREGEEGRGEGGTVGTRIDMVCIAHNS